ncbi:MAG: hypothetical protein AB1779_12100, partial [Candidatus Thermoplasmatota archaeon]
TIVRNSPFLPFGIVMGVGYQNRSFHSRFWWRDCAIVAKNSRLRPRPFFNSFFVYDLAFCKKKNNLSPTEFVPFTHPSA